VGRSLSGRLCKRYLLRVGFVGGALWFISNALGWVVGQDRLRPLSYPGTNLVLLCFALSDRRSFDRIRFKWQPEVAHHLPGTCCVLVGYNATATDAKAKEAEVVVSSTELTALQRDTGAVAYFVWTDSMTEQSLVTMRHAIARFGLKVRGGGGGGGGVYVFVWW
jgi:hypothetical protein